ncbi:MAG TPA: hypothetical protein VN445_04465 [Rectinemataceae bacterium]|nr:hypothetical protein [Rectinemataceae bacterium]
MTGRLRSAVSRVSSRGGFLTAAPFFCAAVLVLWAMTLASCSGRLETTIRNDMSARMALRLEVPEALSARVRQIGGIASKSELFDVTALKEEFSGRKSIFLVDVSAPSPESLTSVIWVPDIRAFVDDRSLVPATMITFKSIPASGSQPAQRELSVSLTRDNAAAAFALFPGVDGKVLDSLSPPALEKDPITAEEYRMNLETVIIGKKTMPAFDACALDVAITAPRTILSSSGGTVQGQVFKVKIPFFDMLTLEKPISFSIRWAE